VPDINFPRSAGYSASGDGPVVMLLHSSVSGRREWRSLTSELEGRFRVVALDLIGYGDTPAWDHRREQRLQDQSELVHAVAADVGPPLALVGHSFGASVALCAAAEMGDRLAGLVLLEPNPFSILRETEASEYSEILALRDSVKSAGEHGNWSDAAERFADYWNGPGTWAMMPRSRRDAFIHALTPNYHEWDAIMASPAGDYVSQVTAATHVISARDTVPPIAKIVSILEVRRPDWRFVRIDRGGHMAPLTQPDLVNSIVSSALDALTNVR
jgi:pimeloyl-ACP methyl ester carboxylesterase